MRGRLLIGIGLWGLCGFCGVAYGEVLVADPIVRSEVGRLLGGQAELDKKEGFKVFKNDGATALKAIILDDDEWPASRARAIDALARDFKSPETLAFLGSLLGSRCEAAPLLKRRMLDALSVHFKAEAPPILEKALAESDILVRESALLGLVATLGAKAKPLLLAQQEREKEPYLQRLLAKQLKKLN